MDFGRTIQRNIGGTSLFGLSLGYEKGGCQHDRRLVKRSTPTAALFQGGLYYCHLRVCDTGATENQSLAQQTQVDFVYLYLRALVDQNYFDVNMAKLE
jgi:hypothetical protein